MFLSKVKNFRLLMAIFFVLIAVSVACAIPGLNGGTEEATEEASPVAVEDLPPTVVEVSPMPGSQLGLSQPLTFYFNQPMEKTTVEMLYTLNQIKRGRWNGWMKPP